MISRAHVLALGLGLAACAIPEDDVVDVEVTPVPRKQCPDGFCGSNSPIIKVYGTHGFQLDGLVNDQGFVYLGMNKNHSWFRMSVENSRIIGRDYWGQIALEDQNLVGAKIWIGYGSLQFAISIQAVGTFNEVVPPYSPIQTYILEWDEAVGGLPLPLGVIPAGADINPPKLRGEPYNVCPAPPVVTGAELEWDESAQMVVAVPYHSIVFEGDRIHADNRTVEKARDDRWFNIGCGRHTLAKMRLTRNVLAFQGWEQVQSVMKMLTADYCGVGAFTVPGHPLIWRDGGGDPNAGMAEYHGTPLNLEARWGPRGALCLQHPRYYTLGEISKECSRAMPKPCANRNPLAWDNELVNSANPL